MLKKLFSNKIIKSEVSGASDNVSDSFTFPLNLLEDNQEQIEQQYEQASEYDRRVPINNRHVYQNIKYESPTEYVLGLSRDNEVITGDLKQKRNILITGNVGAGKTVWIHQAIMSMLAHNKPEDIKLSIIDQKRADYIMFQNSPYLLINPLHDGQEIIDYLNRVKAEIEHRNKVLSKNNINSIDELNSKEDEQQPRMNRWLIVIDEYADLLMEYKAFKQLLIEIGQLIQSSNDIGIHIIMSTAMVRVDTVSSEIKSLFDLKLALHIQTQLQSELSIDKHGAEKLKNFGDMIMKSDADYTQFQSMYFTDEEIESICNYHRQKYPKPNLLELKTI